MTDAETQIDKLAKFILAEVPGEPSQDQSAVDTAIRLLAENAKLQEIINRYANAAIAAIHKVEVEP